MTTWQEGTAESYGMEAYIRAIAERNPAAAARIVREGRMLAYDEQTRGFVEVDLDAVRTLLLELVETEELRRRRAPITDPFRDPEQYHAEQRRERDRLIGFGILPDPDVLVDERRARKRAADAERVERHRIRDSTILITLRIERERVAARRLDRRLRRWLRHRLRPERPPVVALDHAERRALAGLVRDGG